MAADPEAKAIQAIQRASQGDGTAMPEVRRPSMLSAPRTPSSALPSPRRTACREAARRHLADLRAELAGPNPTPLEGVLAERAALALYDASRLDREALSRTDLTWQTADLLDRRRSRAHARALAAVRSLAVVRRLLKGGPAVAVGVQVNVGRDTEVQQSG